MLIRAGVSFFRHGPACARGAVGVALVCDRPRQCRRQRQPPALHRHPGEAQLVLTAGHCLFDHRLGRWVKPEHVHFVAGQARSSSIGHAKAEAFIIPPNSTWRRAAILPKSLRGDLFAHDWALIPARMALAIKPVPIKAIVAAAVAQEVGSAEIARAGYSADRRYLLSVHRGCAAALGQRARC